LSQQLRGNIKIIKIDNIIYENYEITNIICVSFSVLPWLDTPVYPSRHYADTLSPSDIGIVRTHPPNYYEQFGNQLDQQYGGTAQYGNQYGNSQYGFVYPQRAYYPQEKRFMVSKKRSQVSQTDKDLRIAYAISERVLKKTLHKIMNS